MTYLKHLKCTLATCVFHPSPVRRRAEQGTDGSGHRRPRMVARPGSCKLRLRLAYARSATVPSPGAWPEHGGGRSTAWRGGDGGRFSHRAGAWNLEAEVEAPATGSSGNYSRWGWLAAYLGGEYLLSAEMEASRGTGRLHGVRRSREFFL